MGAYLRNGAVLNLILVAAMLTLPGALPLQAQEIPPRLSSEQVTVWMKELSNWGRWGPNDELGTLNLITAEKRRKAATLVLDGVVVSLGRDADKETAIDNHQPLGHAVNWTEGPVGWGIDSYSINYHGYSYSHVDGLAHTGFDGQLYNGFSTNTVTDTGAQRLGIEMMRDGLFTRAVLVDLPRLHDIPFLEPGTAVTTQDIEKWLRITKVTVEPGDVLLIRTGRWVKRAQDGPWPAGDKIAGLHASTAPWLRERDIAAVGCDGITDVLPSGIGEFSHPLHQLALVAMGMPLLDNLDLDELAKEAAARGRWTFLFSVAPIRLTGGLGTPINPIVIF